MPRIKLCSSVIQSKIPAVPLSRTIMARRRNKYANVVRPVKNRAKKKLIKRAKRSNDTGYNQCRPNRLSLHVQYAIVAVPHARTVAHTTIRTTVATEKSDALLQNVERIY